jgi:hypothetical protein
VKSRRGGGGADVGRGPLRSPWGGELVGDSELSDTFSTTTHKALRPYGADAHLHICSQSRCKIGKTTRAWRSAEGASPLPEREVSSLPPSFPPPEAAKQGGCNSPEICFKKLDSHWLKIYTIGTIKPRQKHSLV